MSVSVRRVVVEGRDADTGEVIFTGTPDLDSGDQLTIVRAGDQPALLVARVHDMSGQLSVTS